MVECRNCNELRKDLKSVRAGLSEILSMLSGEATAASSGEQAANQAASAKPDSLIEIVGSNELPEDESLFQAVIRLITDVGYASIMVLQHRLEMDYRQAANIVAELERAELIGPAHGFRPHKALPAAYALRERFQEGSIALNWQEPAQDSAQEDLFENSMA